MSYQRLIFILFLVFSISPSKSVEQTTEMRCEDELESEIVSFLESNEADLIPKLYHLTTLKLASVTARENRITIEQLADKWKNHLKRSDEYALKELLSLYQKHQLDIDIEKLHRSFEHAQYWQSSLRFENADVSAFILAHSKLAKESKLNQTDAATVWFMQRLLDVYPKGSREFNQLNISSRVVRYTGAIIGKQKLSAAELEEEMVPLLEEIETSLAQIVEPFLTSHEHCKEWWSFQRDCLNGLIVTEEILPDVFLELQDDFKNIKIQDLGSDLKVHYGEVEFRLPHSEKGSGQKRTARSAPILQLEREQVFLENRRKYDRRFVEIKDQDDRIHFFHSDRHEPSTKLYGIVDKQERRIDFFGPQEKLRASFKIVSEFDENDKAQGGGAGIYSYSYLSRQGQFFLGDHKKRNIGIKLEDTDRAREFFQQADVIYILPLNSGFYFKVKDERLIFTRNIRLQSPGDYNLTPRRKEFRALSSFITNPDYVNDVSLKFVKTLDDKKKELMELYDLENDDYNDLAKMAFGILGNESKFGTSIKYRIKEVLPLVVSFAKGNFFNTDYNSRGPTQIKRIPQRIADKYNITKEELVKPEKAALATLGFLAEALEELKAKEVHHPDITPENRVDYLHYIYMGKSDEITKATATPEKNIYLRQLKKISESLVQAELP